MNFIVDNMMPDIMLNTLSRFGAVYKSTKIDIDDIVVSTHPDMQIHFVSNNIAFCAPEVYDYYKEILPVNILLYPGSTCVGRTYPSNCAYNIGRVGNFVICNKKYADKNILEYYIKSDKKIINVNQGYTKCNICPITQCAFITEDSGIYNATQNIDGITPYLINAGSVSLNGFDYGFIGGASGLLKNEVLLCGRLPEGETGKIMNDIAMKEEIKYIELSGDKLQDLGSIIVF